jgi:antitoxin HicB
MHGKNKELGTGLINAIKKQLGLKWGIEMEYRYPVRMLPDDNGTILVTFPDVPEAITFGENEQDALARAAEALEAALAGYIDKNVDIPRPSQPKTKRTIVIGLPALTDAKVSLYTAMRRADVTRAELARQLGWQKSQIGRLLDLNHESRLDKIEQALRALGKRLEIRVTAA